MKEREELGLQILHKIESAYNSNIQIFWINLFKIHYCF